MTSHTANQDDLEFNLLERVSGIPPKGKLGASRGELYALVIGILIFAMLAFAFWWEASG